MSSPDDEPADVVSLAAEPGDVAGLNIVQDPGGARAEDVRQVVANIAVGARLLTSSVAFLFMAFLFAFFYLRTINSDGLWRPRHVDPVQGYGIAGLALVALSAVVFDLARRDVVDGTEARWRSGSVAAVILGLLVVAAQVLEYLTISFTTSDGGWASVFWGWTVVQLIAWLGAVYWIETLTAQSIRRPRASPRLGSAGSELLRPSADAATIYLYAMVIIEAISYVLLYLIR